MSIRQAIRSRFKSLERDHRDTDSPPKRKGSTDSTTQESDKHLPLDQHNGHKDAASPLASPMCSRQLFVEGDLAQASEEEDKKVYELQLTQLQEQLVAAMIENQSLASELDEFKEKNRVKQLEEELEYEKERSKTLEKKIEDDQKKGPGTDWVEVAHEVQEDTVLPGTEDTSKLPWRQRVNRWFMALVYEVLQDFSEEGPLEEEGEQEEDQLAVKKLKENIKRFKSGTKPIYTSIKGIYSVLQWKYPAFTLLAFITYMYSVWHGWLLPVFLFLLIFRLFINYLRHKGWNINIKYFSDYEEEDRNKESDNFKDLGVSDKFNLVLQVARKVQNGLGTIADNLEKLKNLLTWEQPEATARLFFALCAAFMASCLLPGETLFFMGGLYMGIKWFIIEYIYHRFPRIKAKHDSVHQIWQTLPTDADLEKRYHRAAINRNVLEVQREPSVERDGRLSDDNRGFCELFNLPATEHPLPGWEGGRRCTIINKDKPLPSAFKHGKLYLTRSFICFERYKTQNPKNVMIALSDITSLHKAKPYSWLPGGGMSIEISVVGYERPYIFGTLLGRDEAYESIIANGRRANLPWAEGKEGERGDEDGKKDLNSDSLAPSPQPGSPRSSPSRSLRMSEIKDVDDEFEDFALKPGI